MRLKGKAFVLDEKIFLFIVMSLDAEVQGADADKISDTRHYMYSFIRVKRTIQSIGL